jgi:hypothetical protein
VNNKKNCTYFQGEHFLRARFHHIVWVVFFSILRVRLAITLILKSHSNVISIYMWALTVFAKWDSKEVYPRLFTFCERYLLMFFCSFTFIFKHWHWCAEIYRKLSLSSEQMITFIIIIVLLLVVVQTTFEKHILFVSWLDDDDKNDVWTRKN